MSKPYRQPKSPFWWISYYVNGHQVRQSTKTDDLKKAKRILAEKIVSNKIPDKRTIGHLLDDLIANYQNNHRKTVKWCSNEVESQLRPAFGTMKTEGLNKQNVLDYIGKRRAEGMKNSSINREISLLRRSFSIADIDFPRIPKLVENNTRKGFVLPEEYVTVLNELPSYIQPIYTFAYQTGCRTGEIISLKWTNLNLRDELVRFEPGETKNSEGRSIPLTSDLVSMFESMPHVSEYVFTRNGKRILSFKDAWDSACKRAGVPGRHFHDLRRTGIRNFIRAGVPEHVAMSFSGHKTRAVFDRYNITSETDQREALVKLEKSRTTLERQAQQKLPGALDKFLVKK
jgi:integrase